MKKSQAKKIFGAVVLLYLASFIIINWNDVSWIFNYKAVAGITSDFFNPYPSDQITDAGQIFLPNHSQATIGQTAVTAQKQVATTYTDKKNTIEIPKIGISVPIIFSQSTDESVLMTDLDKGVIFYPGSVLPGQDGQTIILGHSAPVGWPHIKHDWVFSDLENLAPGDKVLIDLENKQYTYIVTGKAIINKGADVPATKGLTLVSCWPPGKDYKRIAITTELAMSN
jgi:LPXTG-site transpeptidase (sortase) family protein